MTSARILGFCLSVCAVTCGLLFWPIANIDGREELAAVVQSPPQDSGSSLSSPLSKAERLVVAFQPRDAGLLIDEAFDQLLVPPPANQKAVPFDPGNSGGAINQPSARSDKKAATTRADQLTILHIGDSHTSADFFTGEVRQVLQAQLGRGGIGYMPAGLPNGFRSSLLKITVSDGWKYKSLQSPGSESSEFRFSGYNAVAVKSGQTITIKPLTSINFESIEIEALAQPEGGTIDVRVNGQVENRRDLRANAAEPVLIKIAAPSPAATLRELSITTAREGTVSLSSISIYNNSTGLTYNSVGYSGATVNILNKIEPTLFKAALRQINPRIVVLSFGTNESAQDFDLASYNERYARVVRVIRTTLPSAAVVIIAPPDFNRLSPECPKPKRASATCWAESAAQPPTAGTSSGTTKAKRLKTENESACLWHTPTTLDQVREVQRKIAERHRLTYWNWGSIMPKTCGAHEWFKATPPLMSPDHVHFTAAGYRKSATEFLAVLMPIVDRVLAENDAIPHR